MPSRPLAKQPLPSVKGQESAASGIESICDASGAEGVAGRRKRDKASAASISCVAASGEAESEVVDATASSAEAMRTSEAALCALDESVELSTGAVIMSFGRKTAADRLYLNGCVAPNPRRKRQVYLERQVFP